MMGDIWEGGGGGNFSENPLPVSTSGHSNWQESFPCVSIALVGGVYC